MSTTVRVREEDKRRLDELQARITLETGERVPLEEVVHRLVELGERHTGDLVRSDEPPQLTDEEKDAILSRTYDLGRVTREEDIDDVLYGGPEGPA